MIAILARTLHSKSPHHSTILTTNRIPTLLPITRHSLPVSAPRPPAPRHLLHRPYLPLFTPPSPHCSRLLCPRRIHPTCFSPPSGAMTGFAKVDAQSSSSHESQGFVQPSSFLRRPRTESRPVPTPKALTAADREQTEALVRHVAASRSPSYESRKFNKDRG